MKVYLVLEVVKRTVEGVEWRVKHQTFRNCNFYKNSNRFLSSNRLVLYSIAYPSVAVFGVYFRGSNTIQDNNILFTKLDKFEEIKVAVKEYNKAMQEIYSDESAELIY